MLSHSKIQTNIEELLNELNSEQRKAAETFYGPVLVLAGAGSGKTKTLTYRIANMYAHGISLSNMFVATFTNKAAREMKERIEGVIGKEELDKLWIGTFHSLCARILRQHAHLLGYDNQFIIYDSEDTLKTIQRIYQYMSIAGEYKEGLAMHYIDDAKNNLQDPEYCLINKADTSTYQVMAQVYQEYQHLLKQNNAMDFGDLIMNTVKLLQHFDDVREYWQNKFQFVMADEYQDVNHAQFILLALLAYPQNNIFVVGDDSQAIYGFRGSDIQHILSFEKRYFPCTTIYLNQNYRSNEVIVKAGNEIIKHNTMQKQKELKSNRPGGPPIRIIGFDNEYQEAAYIGARIKQMVKNGQYRWKDFAILYRTNAQSLVFEQMFVPNFIPYKVIGGAAFFERMEIKDIVAYLRVIHNTKDDTSLLRILNTPSRGIGKTTQDIISKYAAENKISVYRALKNADDIPSIKKTIVTKINEFLDLLRHLQHQRTYDLRRFIEIILKDTGYLAMWQKKKTKEAEERLDNINEFLKLVSQYQKDHPDRSLGEFLQEISLMTNVEETTDDNAVRFMTIHASKGLEFPVVFITGCNESIFPSWRSKQPNEIEEERRLAYVGITRAKDQLFLTYANQRNTMRGLQVFKPSRFLDEIPEEITQKIEINQ